MMSREVVHRLADEVLGLQSTFDPLNATMLGVPGYNDRLADPRLAAEQALRARAVRIVEQASAIDLSMMSEDDSITVAVVVQQARALADRIDARMVEYTVTDNNYVGPAATMLTLIPVATLSGPDDADAYIDRLRRVPASLE